METFRLLPYLAEAARAARLRAGASEGTVAGLAGVKEVTIERFEELADVPPEDGQGKWPLNPDRHINAYAQVSDCEPIDLWRAAIGLANDAATGPGEAGDGPPPRPDLPRHLPPDDDEALDESA